jgi:hypothetical protein
MAILSQSKEWACIYRNAKGDAITMAMILKFKDFVDQEYLKLTATHSIDYVQGQPYAGLEDILEDYNRSFLRVSVDHNEALICDSETNLKFRAIHDAHHCIIKAGFDFKGELATYNYVQELTNDAMLKAILFSEICLQACYALEFGEFAGKQKVVLLLAKS